MKRNNLLRNFALVGLIVIVCMFGGLTGCEKTETYDWPDSDLAQMIPEPEGDITSLYEWDEDSLDVTVEISEAKYCNEYIKACKEVGFDVDIKDSSFDDDYDFSAKNADGVSLEIYNFDETMYISLDTTSSVSTDAEEDTDEDADTSADSSQVSPDLKETLDAYEAFMDEYIEFMEDYSDADTPSTEMMAEYAEIMGKYSDFAAKIEKLDEDSMSDADLAYYTEVTTRVSSKLLNVSY